MGEVGSESPDPTVLLADADVLIDYRESELAILALVGQHVARVAVLPPVLDEVHGVTATECAEFGIEIVEVETAPMLQAAEIESRVSFNDRLCLVMCRENEWTCVTNDGALRRLCERHGVETRFGLGLMVEDAPVTEQPHADAGALPLADFGAQLDEQRLDVPPRDVGRSSCRGCPKTTLQAASCRFSRSNASTSAVYGSCGTWRSTECLPGAIQCGTRSLSSADRAAAVHSGGHS